MLVKLSIISTKSKVLFKPSFTKYDDDASITTFITEKKFNVENVVEVLAGNSFVSLTSVDKDCINEITLLDLKEDGKTLHLKVVMK